MLLGGSRCEKIRFTPG